MAITDETDARISERFEELMRCLVETRTEWNRRFDALEERLDLICKTLRDLPPLDDLRMQLESLKYQIARNDAREIERRLGNSGSGVSIRRLH
jgi:hypothetical protein